MKTAQKVSEYIRQFPKPVQLLLKQMRALTIPIHPNTTPKNTEIQEPLGIS